MEFNIRCAKPEDAEAIAHVHVESWRSTYAGIVPADFLAALDEGKRAESWREQLLAANMTAFVAEDSSKRIFGFIAGGKLREPIGDYDAELYAVYLLAEQQRLGAGRAMTHALTLALGKDGFNSMVVWVLEKNLSAVAFYQSLGGVWLRQKPIEIGGVELTEIAFGLRSLDSCVL